jgi:hypothetical protein
MKRLVLYLVAFVVAITITGTAAASVDDQATLQQILNYRHWALVNPEPLTTQIPISLATPIGMGAVAL